MIRALLLATCMLSTAAVGLDMSTGTFIHIKDKIGSSTAEIIDLIDSTKEDINMVITSPGGNILAGTIIISAMERAQERGIKIKCIVPVLAASMAFHIFAYCDERYVFPRAFLLFHEGAVTLYGAYTARKLGTMKQQLKLITYQLEQEIIEKLGVSKRKFHKYNRKSFLFPAVMFMKLFPKFKMKAVKDVKLPEGIKLFDVN